MARRKAQDEQPEAAPLGPLPSYPYGKPTTRPDGSPLYHVLQTQTTYPQPLPGSLQEVADRVEAALCGVSTEELTHPQPQGPFHQLILGVNKEAEGIEAEPSIGTDDGAADSTPNANTETPTPNANTETQGDTLPTSTAAVVAGDVPAHPLTRDRSPAYTVKIRLEREGRWPSIEPIRDDMMRAARKQGMDKAAAQAWTYAELDRLYPPLPPKADKPTPEPAEKPIPAAAMVDLAPPAADLPGLYVIPSEWPPLPDNASLQQELGWVQSQRLAVVEERGNATIVRLERASSPAPSKAALGWLETSIRSYAKYIEVAAKTLAGQADEAESTRRERMRLDEIRALLDEMHKDAV